MNILVNTSMGISTMKCLGVGSLHHRLCVSKILGDTVFQSATNLLHSLADYEHFYYFLSTCVVSPYLSHFCLYIESYYCELMFYDY